MMNTTISDDFDLKKIAESGQIFRANYIGNSTYEFISVDKYLLISREKDTLSISCSEEEWLSYWFSYFDLTRSYSDIRKLAKEDFFKNACSYGQGIRILNQDPWEMLISFIISQRKSIPAIKSCIEKLCKNFGDQLPTNTGAKDTFYAFPTAEALYKADNKALAECGLGYRLDYIKDAASKIYLKEIDLNKLYGLSDEELSTTLKSIKGVGEKVANCIMLFAYARFSRVPVDTWVNKIMEEDFRGSNPFTQYGDVAGIMQQYAFFYKREISNNLTTV